MSRLFSTWRSSTRHSHAAHKHNLNHIGGYHAPDKSIRYVNRIFRVIPTYRNRTTNLAPRQYPIPTFTPVLNLFARGIASKPPASGLSADASSNSVGQVDVEGWVDPEEMPSLRGTSMDDGSGNYSVRHKHKEDGFASPYPTDSEASVSADKQNMSTQEMIQHTTKTVKTQLQFTQIEEEEQPVHDDDIASHSTQGGRQPSTQMMSGEDSNESGKINAGVSHPASYGSNPEINKPSQPHSSSSTAPTPSKFGLGHVNEQQTQEIESSKQGANHSSVMTAMTLEEEENMRHRNQLKDDEWTM